MKVIDLLNKIANGEEVPKRIMYNNIIYTWDIVGYLHYEDKHYSERAFLEGYRTDMCLNDEVEIIEDKKIEKFYFSVYQDQKLGGRAVVEPLGTKINEIIDKINGDEENEN